MNILLQCLVWQFWDVPKAILNGWKNFLLFNSNYFSLATLLKTFFSHWRKYYSPYGKTFEIWKNIESFVFNMMSRVIGAILRTILIILGFLVEVLIILIGAVVFFGWLITPILLITGFIFGINLLL